MLDPTQNMTQHGNQHGREGQAVQGGSERKDWPFKPRQQEMESGSPEFAPDSLRGDQQSQQMQGAQTGRRQRQQQQQGGSSSQQQQQQAEAPMQQGGRGSGAQSGQQFDQGGPAEEQSGDLSGSGPDQFSQDQNRFPRQDEQGQPQRQPRGEEEDASGQAG